MTKSYVNDLNLERPDRIDWGEHDFVKIFNNLHYQLHRLEGDVGKKSIMTVQDLEQLEQDIYSLRLNLPIQKLTEIIATNNQKFKDRVKND